MSGLRALPRTVWLLGAVSLLNDAASDLVYPLVPLFLASVLMAGPSTLGIIEGVAETTSSLLKLVSGVLTDRTRSSKSWVVGGYTIAAIARPLIAFASVWPIVLILRTADRIGKGLRSSPRDALIARAVAADQRGTAFGLHRAMDNAGAVIGPLAAAGLLAAGVPLRDLFLWTAIPGALAVTLALMVREPARATPVPSQRFRWNLSSLPGQYRRYLLVLAIFTLGNSSNMFLLLRARDLGLPQVQVPLIWALVSFTAMVFSTPLSALSDRIGRVRLIIGGWGVYAAFYLVLGLNGKSLMLLWPLFAFYGLFLAATEGAERALVADMVPGDRVGTAYGWFNLVTGLTLLPASFLFGLLWQRVDPLAAFGFATGCATLAALLLAFWVSPISGPPSGTTSSTATHG